MADAVPYDFFLHFDETERERAVAVLRADGWYVETSPTIDARMVIASCLAREEDERALDAAVKQLANSMSASYHGYAPSYIPNGLLRRRDGA